MSSEFTPETERQRLQYLVRVPWVWQSVLASEAGGWLASRLLGRNTLFLTWERGPQQSSDIWCELPHIHLPITHPAPCVTTRHLREFIIAADFPPSVVKRMLCFFFFFSLPPEDYILIKHDHTEINHIT